MEFNTVYPTFSDFVNLDPDIPRFFSVFGRKGEGKTVWAEALYHTWPYDKLVIDPTGDIFAGEDALEIGPDLPDFFPEGEGGEPLNLHYIPDVGLDSYYSDLDKAVGLGLLPKEKKVLLLLDEIGEHTTGNRTAPRLRKVLHQGRHFNCSTIMTGPRPMDIDKLVIAQSDAVVIYDLPDPDDQKKIAQIIGYPLGRFTEALAEMRAKGPYWHLVWANAKATSSGRPALALCAPIALD